MYIYYLNKLKNAQGQSKECSSYGYLSKLREFYPIMQRQEVVDYEIAKHSKPMGIIGLRSKSMIWD